MISEELKKMLVENKLNPNPKYTEDDLKEICNLFQESNDNKAFEIYKQIQVSHYDPCTLEACLEGTRQEYDYYALFFDSSIDNLMLLLGEKLEMVEEIILRWRLDHDK